MNDKWHKILGYAGAIALATLYALQHSALTQGHPMLLECLNLASTILGLLGLTVIKPIFSGGNGSGSGGATVTKLTALVLALGLFTGCAGGRLFGNCLLKNLKNEEVPIAVSVMSLASAPQGYVDALVSLAKAVGKPTVYCAALAILADEQAAHASASALAHLREFVSTMEKADPSLCCSASLP